MIKDFYNELVDVERMDFVYEGSEITRKKEFISHLTNVCANIQPLDPSITQDINTAFGKNLLMFCDVLDIIEGDRIIWKTEEYRIVGVEKYEAQTGFTGPHMEIQIRAFKT